MSINNDFIKTTADYLNTVLDKNTEIAPLAEATKATLPAVVSANYALFETECDKVKLVLAFCEDTDAVTPGTLQKHAKLMERITGQHVVYVFQRMVAYKVQRMIAARVNFIIPGQQMYIPSMFVDLRKPKAIDADITEHMPVLAQCILLYHIEKEPLNGKSARELATLFSVSYATANRAIRWLETNNLTFIERTAEREKAINFANPREVWEKALPLFVNPIEKVVYTDDDCSGWPIAGVNALSEHTMINPDKYQTIALTKEQLKGTGLCVNAEYGDTVVQMWKYPPLLLSTDGKIDKLSLYLSLRESQDERIQMELDTLIDSI